MAKRKTIRKDAAKYFSFVLLPVCLACASVGAYADEDDVYVEPSGGKAGSDKADDFKLGGYFRAWIGANLSDTPELGTDGKPIGGKGDLSMLRASVSLNGSAKTGSVRWYGNIRGDVEGKTSYLRDLERSAQANSPGGPGSDMTKELSGVELREFYFDTDIGDRLKLRVGKQQIVWGETDFFHPSDVIHGFDYRWRQFYEPESDELRKPLILLNGKVDVPELSGNLQLLVRPGLDRKKDIGNSYDLYGGRWMPQPFRGTDFIALLPYDHEHPAGDYKDVTGGLRWTGRNDTLNYSFSWVKTFQGDPVISPYTHPYMKPVSGTLGNFIFPKISVTSGSFSTEVQSIDAVLNGEVALQKGNLFNTSTIPGETTLFGFGPVIQKDVVKTTLRIDKQLRLQDWLGTNQASFASIQLFDSWIKNFNRADAVVAFGGYPALMKEHDTILTGFIVLNYMNSKLNPMLAVGKNLSTGDAFAIPSITYLHGDKWRFNVEADFFHTKHEPSVSNLGSSTQAYPLADFLSNHDQLTLRATYQF